MNQFRKWVLPGIGLLLVAVYTWLGQNSVEDGVWRFNFAPEAAPEVDSFLGVSGNTDYDSGRGYGWLDAAGSLQKGHWPGGQGETWESRGGLNVVMRRGSDDLARSFATGPVGFALDLAAGKYEVWVLSGDSGHLEFTPWLPYRILVEGREVYRYDMTAAQFYRQLETPVLADDLTGGGVWQRYIEPRFTWSSVRVDVTDGQLNVVVVAEERERSSAALAGDYPYTEIGRGPSRRYAGAINALVVVALDKGADRGAEIVADTDAWRQQNFSKKWPLLSVDVEDWTAVKPADRERGYTLYVPHTLETVFPHSLLPHRPETISVRVTAGEVVPLTVAVRPLADLGDTRVEFTGLRSMMAADGSTMAADGSTMTADGSTMAADDSALVSASLVFGVVRYMARPVPGNDRAWQPTPVMIAPADAWPLVSNVSKQFWLSYRIPDNIVPGHYSGSITITLANAAPSRIDVELEVLPFVLRRPTHLSLGMTYFSPVQDAWFDEERFWRRMAAEFADMRAHGFTMVQFTGIGIHDYDRLDRVFQLYREAGFEQALALLESYGAMDRLRRDGIAWDSEAFYGRYQQSIRQLLAEAERRNWPPFVVNFGDEFTNSALEEFGVKVARSLKQIPGIVTAADTNGYKEVQLMAPEVDILAFNNGWEGPEGVNRGKKLLHRGTVASIVKAGAEPWLVNIGTDRFSSGFWLWKMVRLGVGGKIEWLYRGYRGMPYNSFDASPMSEQLVFPGPGATMIPSLDFERMRMGFDDLAYLYTLEQLVASGGNREVDRAALAAAEAFLAKLDDMVDDDMNRYLDDDSRRWPAERYDTLRNEVIDHILHLHR